MERLIGAEIAMGENDVSGDTVFVLVRKNGKYSVQDGAGKRLTKWMTTEEFNRAIRRSTTAVNVAEAVGEEADPILKMVSKQQLAWS